MKKQYYILLTGLLSVIPITILFSVYYYKREQISYDFRREYKDIVKGKKPLDIKYNSYYIAGHRGNDIYLGNRKATRHLLKVNSLLTDTQSILIDVNRSDFKTDGFYKIYIDSSHFYMSNGYARSILSGNTELWKAKVNNIFTPYFSQVVPLSNSSMAFRYVSAKTNNNSLRKESISAKSIQNLKILEKQVDGLFCTDGLLQYNEQLHLLTYVYFYRNQILVIDTNLNLIKKIKTIDPIDSAKIQVWFTKSSNSSTFSSPPLIVNARSASWDKYLFVESKLMGKHEDEGNFKRSTVLDIYDLEKYKYLYSIFLPLPGDNHITDFKVFNGYILTISDHFITRYPINFVKPTQ